MSSRGTDGAFHPEAMNNLFLSEKLIFRPVSCVHLCVCVYVCVYVCVCVCVCVRPASYVPTVFLWLFPQTKLDVSASDSFMRHLEPQGPDNQWKLRRKA